MRIFKLKLRLAYGIFFIDLNQNLFDFQIAISLVGNGECSSRVLHKMPFLVFKRPKMIEKSCRPNFGRRFQIRREIKSIFFSKKLAIFALNALNF